MTPDEFDRTLTDPRWFVLVVLGVNLWDFQQEALACTSRTVILKGGRQVGKSVTCACRALWEAWRRPGSETLIISAGDESAKYLMSTLIRLAKSSTSALKDCVVDEYRRELRFSTGSVITSIPSSEKQARGRSCSLLVLDEARSLPEDMYEAAAPITLAQANPQVWISSTPGGSATGFFRRLFRAGSESPDEWCKSYWWPASLRPPEVGEPQAAWPAVSFTVELCENC